LTIIKYNFSAFYRHSQYAILQPNTSFGGFSGEVTPVPIPNTEVKLSSADGTAWVTVWEIRALPDLKNEKPLLGNEKGFFVLTRFVPVIFSF
jgi:hypothetical protein